MSTNELIQKKPSPLVTGRKNIMRLRGQTEMLGKASSSMATQPRYDLADNSSAEVGPGDTVPLNMTLLAIPASGPQQRANFHLSTCSLAVNLPSVSGDSGRNLDDQSTADNSSILSFPTDYAASTNEPACFCRPSDDVVAGRRRTDISQRRCSSLLDFGIQSSDVETSDKCGMHAQTEPVLELPILLAERVHKSLSQPHMEKISCHVSTTATTTVPKVISEAVIKENFPTEPTSLSNTFDEDLDQAVNRRANGGTEETVAEKCKHWLRRDCSISS